MPAKGRGRGAEDVRWLIGVSGGEGSPPLFGTARLSPGRVIVDRRRWHRRCNGTIWKAHDNSLMPLVSARSTMALEIPMAQDVRAKSGTGGWP